MKFFLYFSFIYFLKSKYAFINTYITYLQRAATGLAPCYIGE